MSKSFTVPLDILLVHNAFMLTLKAPVNIISQNFFYIVRDLLTDL